MKTGDRVRLHERAVYDDSPQNPFGMEGKVISVARGCAAVEWENGIQNGYQVYELVPVDANPAEDFIFSTVGCAVITFTIACVVAVAIGGLLS